MFRADGEPKIRSYIVNHENNNEPYIPTAEVTDYQPLKLQIKFGQV